MLIDVQWRVTYVVSDCNVVATEHGRYGLPCMQKLCCNGVLCPYCDLSVGTKSMAVNPIVVHIERS